MINIYRIVGLTLFLIIPGSFVLAGVMLLIKKVKH